MLLNGYVDARVVRVSGAHTPLSAYPDVSHSAVKMQKAVTEGGRGILERAREVKARASGLGVFSCILQLESHRRLR